MIRNGRSVLEVSESLGISASLIHKWKSRSNLAVSAPSNPVSSAVQVVSAREHEQLKAKVKQLEQERDILKKALGIFSREE